MKNNISNLKLLIGICISCALISFNAVAASQIQDNTKIITVFVNGGIDTKNPGLTCLQISSEVSPSCKGFIAIKNHNRELLAAALQAKTTGSKVWIYYEDADVNEKKPLHCPGQVYTNCSLISIGIR